MGVQTREIKLIKKPAGRKKVYPIYKGSKNGIGIPIPKMILYILKLSFPLPAARLPAVSRVEIYFQSLKFTMCLTPLSVLNNKEITYSLNL